MKVLVFDDSKQHQTSALITLKGHELTVVGTYDEAQKALASEFDYKKADEELKKLFGEFDPYRATDEEAGKKEAYFLAEKTAREKFTTHPDFDAVLTDLMVPASKQAQGSDRLVGQEMPLGTTIALLAISQGIKKVAVVTDMNHHSHPASAAFDCFRESCCAGDLKLVCTNHVSLAWLDEKTMEAIDEKFLNTPEGKEKYPGDWSGRSGLTRGKNWGQILDWLNS